MFFDNVKNEIFILQWCRLGSWDLVTWLAMVLNITPTSCPGQLPRWCGGSAFYRIPSAGQCGVSNSNSQLLGPVPWWWLNKLRVTGLVLSWQNQTSPIWLCWYHEADHQLSLSTQAWSWVNEARAHECVTSVMSSQSYALKLWCTSRERVSAIH